MYLVASKVTESVRARARAMLPAAIQRIWPAIQVLFIFQLVSFAWIFFRAVDLTHAGQIIGGIVHGTGGWSWTAGEEFGTTYLISAVAMIGIMEAVHHLATHGTVRHLLRHRSFTTRWVFYYVLVFLILSFGMFRQPGTFLYFQF